MYKFTEEQEQEIIDFYLMPNSLRETSRHFNIPNRNLIKKILANHGIPLHNKNICTKLQQERAIKTCREKYGTDYYLQTEDKKQKQIKTCLEKYGVNHQNQRKAAKENISKKLREKSSEERQEIREKIKQTNLERYGTESPSQNEEIKAKGLNTLKEKYGGVGFSSNIIKEKIKQTNFEKYGVENPFQVEEFKEKSKQTCIKKYGYEYITQSPKYKAHVKKVLFERYGVYHAPSYKFVYNNEYFDSFPELCFYMYYLKNNVDIIREPVQFDYLYKDKIYHYYPDFRVNNQLYEIKGDWCLTEDGKWYNPFDESLSTQMEAKHQCALANNVIILYQKDYQKYIDWFNEKGYKKEDFLYKKDV